jgi:prepilin peptidase CpaA
VPEGVLFALLLVCLVSDARWHRIPNWATLPGIGVGLILNTTFYGLAGLRQSGIGLAVGFGALFVLFILGWMGGGDVKLMGAVGAIMGYPFVLTALIYSILVGGFIGIVVLIWNKRLVRTMKNIIMFLLSRVLRFLPRHELAPEATSRLPFGIAIVIGTIWAGVMWHLCEPFLLFPQ